MFTRRDLIGGAAIVSGGGMLNASPRPKKTVADCLWLWSHVAGAYSGQYGLDGPSRITPTEAAHFLGIPNLFMVGYNGQPEPESLEQFAIPFQSLRQIAWAIVDPDAKRTSDERRNSVLDFAFRNPQSTGVVMDDFFVRRKDWVDGQVAALSIEELKQVKQRLQKNGKRLDLWVVLYAHEIAGESFPRLAPFLELCDIVQIWPWYGKEIPQMADTLARVEKVAPHVKKAIGAFMWDFGDKKPLTVSAMQQHCEFGLECLKSRRAEAMVICGSWLCDRPIEVVGWTRQWVHGVRQRKL